MNYMIIDTINKWSEEFKSWIFDNYNNPLLWVGILFVGIGFCMTVFHSLNKD